MRRAPEISSAVRTFVHDATAVAATCVCATHWGRTTVNVHNSEPRTSLRYHAAIDLWMMLAIAEFFQGVTRHTALYKVPLVDVLCALSVNLVVVGCATEDVSMWVVVMAVFVAAEHACTREWTKHLAQKSIPRGALMRATNDVACLTAVLYYVITTRASSGGAPTAAAMLASTISITSAYLATVADFRPGVAGGAWRVGSDTCAVVSTLVLVGGVAAN